MADTETESYEKVPYPGFSRPQSHPDRLATLATLFGMSPSAVDNCRVLELGCGDGSNLIPIAFMLPDSKFVGIDSAANAITEAQAMANALGLKNIILQLGNVQDVTADLGCFDYIIAHGIYSWVPSPVRDKILAVCHANLAPNGVAYVSYNTYPGCRLRDITRDIMLFHTRKIAHPQERVGQAKTLVKLLAETTPEHDLYGAVLRNELKRIEEYTPGHLYHDDLALTNQPVYFHEFLAHAARHGLQFLAEANYFAMFARKLAPPATETLSRLADEQLVLKEQYLDFFTGREFRQTLLCHQYVRLDHAPRPERIPSFHVASSARQDPTRDSADAPGAEFRMLKHGSIATDNPLIIAALKLLGERWPQSLHFTELLEGARSAPDTQSRPYQAGPAEDALVLGDFVLQAYAAGLVELHVCPPHLALQAGERPVASPVARLQAQSNKYVTSLRHTTVRLEDQLARQLLLLLDGTRDRQQLIKDLRGLAESGAMVAQKEGDGKKGAETIPEINEEELERALTSLARLALLLR